MNWVKNINKGAFLSILLVASAPDIHAQSLATKNGRVTIFSAAPIEDIKASSDKLTGVLIAKTGEVAFLVPIRSLTFVKGLMQEHFNENYMESDKYPYAKFKGTISPQVDFTKDGEYPVTATGILSVHGVDKQRSIPGKIVVKNGQVRVLSNFNVASADHHIRIPTILVTKVAEVINVDIDAALSPLKQ